MGAVKIVVGFRVAVMQWPRIKDYCSQNRDHNVDNRPFRGSVKYHLETKVLSLSNGSGAVPQVHGRLQIFRTMQPK